MDAAAIRRDPEPASAQDMSQSGAEQCALVYQDDWNEVDTLSAALRSARSSRRKPCLPRKFAGGTVDGGRAVFQRRMGKRDRRTIRQIRIVRRNHAAAP